MFPSTCSPKPQLEGLNSESELNKPGLRRPTLGLRRPRTILQTKLGKENLQPKHSVVPQRADDVELEAEGSCASEAVPEHQPTPEVSPSNCFDGGTKTANTLPVKRAAGVFKSPFSKNAAPLLHNDELVLTDAHFRVLWTKDVKKKHRHYVDGVLCVTARKYTLHDGEGRLVAQKAVGRTVSDLQPDAILQLGGLELEIAAPISAEEYARGTCFEAAVPAVLSRNHQLQKGFSAAARKRRRTDTNIDAAATLHPNAVGADHGGNPSAAERLEPPKDAYVLNAGHPQQDDHGRPILDVWLDPFLCRCLRPHQLQGLQFLYDCVSGQRGGEASGCILADEMGLGKTLTAISLIWVLLRRGPRGHPLAKKVLVVTPSSLVQNWAKEVTKWLGRTRLQPQVVLGERQEAEQQLRAFRTGYQPLLITSYDLCRSHADLLKECRCDLLVCDEGHRLKNDGTQIARALGRIPCRRRVLLTGTPLQNDLQELYALMDFVAPGLLGSRDAFRNLYADCIARSREPGASAKEQTLGHARQEELARRTQPFLLRRTADIVQQALPLRTEFLIFCRLSAVQLALYQHYLHSKAMGQLLGRASGAPMAEALTCVTTLRKLLAHPAAVLKHSGGEDPEGGEWAEARRCLPAELDLAEGPDPALSGKLHFLQALLREVRTATQDKVVVVSISTQALDIIAQMLTAEGCTHLRLDGATPAAKRMPIVDRFNDRRSSEAVLLLSCKAGGVGLNLIGANRMVLFDPDWNPANDAQAKARVWREGQSKPVFIYRLFCTGTLEEKVLQRQQTKAGLSRLVVDESRADCRSHWGRDELRQLFSLNTTDACDTFREEAAQYDPTHASQDLDPVLDRALAACPHVSFVRHCPEAEPGPPYDPPEVEDEEGRDGGAAGAGVVDDGLLIPCDASDVEAATPVEDAEGVDIGGLQGLITAFDAVSEAEAVEAKEGSGSDVDALEVEGLS
eukprot:EG_transcript_1871